MFSNLKRSIRNIFIAGLLVTIPIAFTFFILNFLFKKLDSTLSPIFTQILITFGAPITSDFRIPGVGVIMTLLVIFLVGVFATNIFGRELVRLGEKILAKIPVVRSVYTGTKQVVQTILDAEIETFRKVVMIEFPRKGLWALGFITCENKGEIQQITSEEILNVFVPTTPNPTRSKKHPEYIIIQHNPINTSIFDYTIFAYYNSGNLEQSVSAYETNFC